MISIEVEAPNALQIKPMEEIVPSPGEVLVRVKRAGICGSDVHILNGTNPFALYPRIIGHEVAGVVEELGRK